jgi:magnesium transporter
VVEEGSIWIDLVDPDEEQVRAALASEVDLHPTALAMLTTPDRPGADPRPMIRGDGEYVVGVLVAPHLDSTEREVSFREVDVVVTRTRLVTVRKTCDSGQLAEIDEVRAHVNSHLREPGLALWYLVDDVAERYLDIVDELDARVDDLEEQVEADHTSGIRRSIGDLRRSMLRVRRAIGPLRDGTRAVLDDRIDLTSGSLFPHDVDIRFSDVYDKLLRATEGLDLARDLLAGVRDYHQAQIANDQNDVMKRLTVIASVLLLPTFIVGLYGQNLHGSPEMGWSWGYVFSWALIVVTTIAQILWYRRKRWI